ncbi:hypothetical protein [Paludisphaera rhizosphaerae]|uniref:hypothetical protein n=1 Tax=Paludisphaera rhizosphaerae TaxID=2711216 RepID=UPI0013EDB724|nr:hypothetical protein [Paludisphaera rhizosphaerae]
MATMMKPALPRGNRSRVYQKIVELLQTDPYLSAYFPAPSAWSVSDGQSFNPAQAGTNPHIYLVPRPSAASWYGSDSQSGILQVDVYFWMPGNSLGQYNALDALDCFEVIEQVFYPLNAIEKQQAIRKSLQEAGAKTGLVTFSQPATQQQTAEQGLVSYGALQIDVTRRISP